MTDGTQSRLRKIESRLDAIPVLVRRNEELERRVVRLEALLHQTEPSFPQIMRANYPEAFRDDDISEITGAPI
jgi:hypothetical protein